MTAPAAALRLPGRLGLGRSVTGWGLLLVFAFEVEGLGGGYLLF